MKLLGDVFVGVFAVCGVLSMVALTSAIVWGAILLWREK